MKMSSINSKKMNIQINKKKALKIFFAVILLFQICVLWHLGRKKQEYHIDEIYSYILSNSYDTDRIANDPEVWNQWVKGEIFDKFAAVNEGEQFAYEKTYYNNTLDAHPPLYYYSLHTVCSFFPGQFSKWFGIGLNIVFFIAAQLLLFRLSRKIFGETLWALLPVCVYGGTNAAYNTAIYIRMYMMLTMFALLLANIHYDMLQKSFSLNWGIACFVVTYLGIFTHYYFALFAFFIALFTCIYYLVHKQWKDFIQYGLCMLGAVGAVFYSYPAAIAQIGGSSTNNVGKSINDNLWNFSDWGKSILSMGYYDLKKGLSGGLIRVKLLLILIAAATVILAFWKREKKKAEDIKPDFGKMAILFLFLTLVIVTIAKITGQFIYFRYLYFLIPLVALLIAWIINTLVYYLPFNRQIFAAGAGLFWLCGTYGIYSGNVNAYLYNERYQNNQRIVEMCKDRPLILINNGKTYHPTANFTILRQCENVYMTSYEKMGNIDDILSQVNADNGAVFLVLTDQNWSEGLDGKEVMERVIGNSDLLNSYTDNGECEFSEVYLASGK